MHKKFRKRLPPAVPKHKLNACACAPQGEGARGRSLWCVRVSYWNFRELVIMSNTCLSLCACNAAF